MCVFIYASVNDGWQFFSFIFRQSMSYLFFMFWEGYTAHVAMNGIMVIFVVWLI